ncbi:MAG: transcriptional regulator [Ramlibacter sp.]|jgi:DNA-binding HxlR family transcriptional regulator|nr:transcriptional regulator [Ramlibacter sp.]
MSKTPKPGKPVRGSRSGVPVMALLDLLGRRWALGVLWNLCNGGPCTFRELQERCEAMSPTVLNSRLKELREAGLVEHSEQGYRATLLGRELYALLVPLGVWSKKWAAKLPASLTASPRP